MKSKNKNPDRSDLDSLPNNAFSEHPSSILPEGLFGRNIVVSPIVVKLPAFKRSASDGVYNGPQF